MQTNWFKYTNALMTTSAMLILMLFAACGGSAPPEPVVVEKEVVKEVIKEVIKEVQVEKIVVATPTAAPPPSAVEKPEGHLRIAYTSLGNDGIYPKSSNVNAGGKDIQTTMYDVVIGSDAQGAFSTETGLAHEWSTSSDALQHTIHLRKGVKFHNGEEVTAEDVMFSMIEIMEEDSQAAFNRELTPLLENFEIPAPYTVVINCHSLCPFALWIFSGVRGTDGMVVPMAHYEAVGESEYAKSPVASGPYSFGEQVLGASVRVDAVNAPHFRGGIPKYETITFLGIPEETTRYAMLKSGSADIIDTSRERIDSLKADGFNVFYKERADLMGAYFFQQWEENSPFKDIKVREAINKAINRPAILEHIFEGRGGYAFYPMGSYALSSGLNPDLLTYPYEPDRAKALLKEAGYDKGNPLEVKLAIYPFGGIVEFPRMIEAIGADLEEAGIKVNFQPTEYGTLRNMRKAFELAGWLGPWGTTNRAAPAEILSITRALYYSKAPYTTYKNPEFDAIMDKAFSSVDPEPIKGYIADMQRFLYEDYYGIPLFEVDTPFATVPEITHWDTGRDSYDKNMDSLFFPGK